MLSCRSSNTLTRRKYQRVPQSLYNAKKWTDFGMGLSIGSLTLILLKNCTDEIVDHI